MTPILVALFLIAPVGTADESSQELFERSIRPALVRYCYECHSSASAEPKGGLRLDSRDGVRRGGEGGPAVVPGNVQESLLIAAIRRERTALQMPPDRKLPQTIVRDFERWVAAGAPDPREAPPDAAVAAELQWEAVYRERRGWWSFQPLAPVVVPEAAGHDVSFGPIDRFIQAKLAESGLEPAPEADRTTLVRRLSFALTGLPPSEALLDSALRASGPDWWGRLVDRVLASPHFGERFARHWMDIARFSETYGYEWDLWAKGAWRYRDYLIRAFNLDLPYDDFVREHVAGDLLEEPRLNTDEGINESLVGPMFFQMGEKRHDDTLVFNGIHQDMVDDLIDSFSKAFQGLTLSCARCHDHKLDPLSQREYYALAGIFMSSRWVTNTLDLPERNAVALETLRAIKAELQPLVATSWLSDLERFDEDLLAASERTADEEQDETLTGSATRAAKLAGLLEDSAKTLSAVTPETGKASPLEDPLFVWTQLLARDAAGEPVESVWLELKAAYTEAAARRQAENDASLQIIADFRDGIPPGWSVDGVGLETVVPCGDFVVALDGDGVVESLLEGGLFTHSLSPRLNGAVRTPYLLHYDQPRISFEQVGGEFSAHRTVFDNEFLTEHQQKLHPGSSGWLSLRTHHTLKERRAYIEFATKTSNPNFPPRIGKCRECTPEVVGDPRSWFGLTRVALHDEGFTPQDTLSRFLGLFSGDAPQTLSAAAARYTSWWTSAVTAWRDERATSDDVWLVNWLLARDLLDQKPERGDGTSRLLARYRDAERRVATPQTVNGMIDNDPGYDYPLDLAGDYDRPGERVPRGFPQLLVGQDGVVRAKGSGRRELADVIADPANPLTARVFVNRVWYWLFGTGIVDTPSNFGHVGGQPSHPELLDHLAGRFIAEGWSIKRLVRAIVTTRTWRQSGQASPAALELDPLARNLAFFPMRRLEAEAIRDALLATSGRLDARLYGPSALVYVGDVEEGTLKRVYVGAAAADRRRSVYTRVSIMDPPAFLAAFNQPDPKIPTGRRDVTSTPAQSLALLNGSEANAQAEQWARALIEVGHQTPADRLEHMFLRAFGRRPMSAEIARWGAAVDDFAGTELGGGAVVRSESLMSSVPLWQAIAHALYNTKEFIYVR